MSIIILLSLIKMIEENAINFAGDKKFIGYFIRAGAIAGQDSDVAFRMVFSNGDDIIGHSFYNFFYIGPFVVDMLDESQERLSETIIYVPELQLDMSLKVDKNWRIDEWHPIMVVHDSFFKDIYITYRQGMKGIYRICQCVDASLLCPAQFPLNYSFLNRFDEEMGVFDISRLDCDHFLDVKHS